MMEKLKGWKDLGVVSTIYEEDDEEEEICSDSSSLSSCLSPPQSRSEAWTLAKGCDPDVLIRVGGVTFRLHKEPLSSRSGFLKRNLKESSDVTLSPPLNITPETFSLVADFCYNPHIIITPFNVVALKIASQLLEMTESTKGCITNDNLGYKLESYLHRYIGINRDYTLVIFKSCLSMLPEAEKIGGLVSRCIESLLLSGYDGIMSCINDVKILLPKNFHIVAEVLSCQLTGSHDILYKIIDLYLKGNGSKMTEDEKTKLCNCIDCTTLSQQLLIHAVQNPKMPLRFIVQAMFVDQLHTRRSILSAAAAKRRQEPHTLGGILERDAAVRRTSQLKASMDATCTKIKSLEQELEEMKQILNETESGRSAGRSVSSRFEYGNKVERGQRGSVSSTTVREISRRGDSGSQGSVDKNLEKSFGRKVVERLKSAFVIKKKSEETVRV